ncbi:MAG: sugar phosphate isomerase/epimerase family protein [Planctomycetota bacterium]
MTTPLSPASLAVCSWSLQPDSADALVRDLAATGVKRTQLHLNPLLDAAPAWADTPAKLADAGIAVVSGMITTLGEDYSTLESIRQTGGVVPDEHWPANRATAERAADLAASLGLTHVSFHAGFIPHDPADPGFAKLRDRLADLADLFAARDLRLLLETGQETAAGLTAFLDRLGKPNVAVNFDPANMLLYGMGDPIESMLALMPRIEQAHIKDAIASDTLGQWGAEVPVGEGQVPWPRFVKALQDAGYAGDLVIEREAGTQRIADIRTAAAVIEATL